MSQTLDRRKKLWVAAAVAGIVAVPALQSADKPAFEVASVKENKSGARDSQIQVLPGGKFVAHNMPLWFTITWATTFPFNPTA